LSLFQISKNGLVAPERKRLGAEIGLARQLWDNIASCNAASRAQDAIKSGRLARALAVLKEADENKTRRDLDSGWKYLHEAKRLSLFELDEQELRARALSLAVESSHKSSAWRKAAVGDLLREFESTGTDCKPHCLAEAYRSFQEESDNTYFKMRTLRRQMFLLGGCMLGLIGIFLYFYATGLPDPAGISGAAGTSDATAISKNAVKLKEVLRAGALGGIGACLSGLSSFASAARPDQRIPETLSNVSVTLTRPLIGIASGIAAILAIKANLIPLKMVETGDIIPFAFGFSERLVMGTFNKIGERS
jgi:hypothetical protein